MKAVFSVNIVCICLKIIWIMKKCIKRTCKLSQVNKKNTETHTHIDKFSRVVADQQLIKSSLQLKAAKLSRSCQTRL